MVAFLYRMNNGIPGVLTGADQATVEPGILNAAANFAGYGLPGKVVAGAFQPIVGGDTAASVYGILVRAFPTSGSPTGSTALGSAVPATTGIVNVLKRGYIYVAVNGATAPAKNGAVYVRIAVGTGTIIGGFEAAADGLNTVALTNAYFMGTADASGNSAIGFNI